MAIARAHGRAPVVGTALLDDIANRRAAHMAQDDKLEHDMAYVSQRLNDAGVCWSGFGEIIAWENYPDYSARPHHGDVVELTAAPRHHAGRGLQRSRRRLGYRQRRRPLLGNGVRHPLRPVNRRRAGQRPVPGRPVRPEPRAGAQGGPRHRVSPGRSGAVLSQKSVKLVEDARVRAAAATRENGKAWLKVSSGALAGYWVHETNDSFVRGLTQRDNFDADKQVTLEAGRYLGMRFDWLGRVKASQDLHLRPRSGRCRPRRTPSSAAATTSCSAPARCPATGCGTRRRSIRPDRVRREPPS